MGATGPGQGAPFGPESIVNELSEDWFGESVVPRFEFGFDFVAAALGRRRKEAPVGAEEVEVEALQAASAAGRSNETTMRPVCGSRWIDPGSLIWVPKPSPVMKIRYLLPG